MKHQLRKKIEVYKVYLAVAKEQAKDNQESFIQERIRIYETVIADLAQVLEEDETGSLVTEVAQEYFSRPGAEKLN